jgi:tripeptidyl-peptidase-1
MRNNLLIVAGLVAGSMALPSSSHIVHERRSEALMRGWEKREAADPNAMVPVRIALKQSNIEKGDDYLMEM